MEYEIKALCPELAGEFADYMMNLDFGHEPGWATCFCRYYQTNCSQEKWYSRTGEENRLEAIEENNGSRERLYRGTLNMYKELSFEEIEKDGDTSIMLLKFRP